MGYIGGKLVSGKMLGYCFVWWKVTMGRLVIIFLLLVDLRMEGKEIWGLEDSIGVKLSYCSLASIS